MKTPRTIRKIVRLTARIALGLALLYAGIGHLTYSRLEFQAQVPVWLPLEADFVVLASGVVEILLGLGLLTWGKVVPMTGLAAAAFSSPYSPATSINLLKESMPSDLIPTKLA